MARDVMTSARSTPNLQQQAPPTSRGSDHHHASIYSYLHTQSGLNFAPVVHHRQGESGGGGGSSSPPPAPPVRDASSLKGVKYGPGHEKFPSWPVSAAADTPAAAKTAPGGGSHRSKSWTDHTNYPKEKGMTYTRPYMKRPNPAFTQQLKTVMERCEKLPPEMFEPRPDVLEDSQGRLYLPRVDREGKALGDLDYLVPSPPERDLEEFKPGTSPLTQADLEEYSRVYQPQMQQQPSYAQSEGYHSYVSSTDSTTTTPFLDRLRRDSEMCARPVPGPQAPWPDDPPERDRDRDRPGRDSVVTTSSGSASSSETLKWHGSLSDVSVASSNCTQQGSSSTSSSRQLIAHSARVQTPQRHHSESVLYLGGAGGNRVARNNQHNKLRLFPVHTYTVQPQESQQAGHRPQPLSPSSQPALSVAERISELERQQLQTRYTYLDPEKRLRVSDTNLKAIQKKALLSFYERHHGPAGRTHQAWRSEPQLAQSIPVPAPQSPPPQPPPRPGHSSRRASSASDYAGGGWKQMAASRETMPISESNGMRDPPRHQHSSSLGSLSADLLGPLIVGPSISVDDWVPERPHKPPHLRAAFPPPPVPERMPSPDLPPPSPPPVLEDEVFATDEPLPPPPPELHPLEWSVPPSDKRPGDVAVQKSSDGSPDLPRFPDKNTQSQRHADFNNLSDRLQDGAPPQNRHSENASTLQRLCLPVSRHSDSSSLNHRHHESALSTQRNEGSSTSRYYETDTVVQSNPERVSPAHRSPEFDPGAPRHPDTGLSSPRHQETVPQRHEPTDQKSPETCSTSQNPAEPSSAVERQSESDTTVERQPESGNSVQRHSDNSASVHKHSDNAQRHVENGSTVPRNPENSNQRHMENTSTSHRHFENGATVQRQPETVYSNQRHSENSSTIPRHSETGFTVHRHPESYSAAQKHSQNSSLSPRYLENSHNVQRHSEMGSTFQRYPETAQRHTESGHAIHRYLETGSTAQRYQENLLSTHRHQEVTGSTVHRHTERNPVSQKHLEHDHHAQRHVVTELNHSTLQRPVPQRHHEVVHPASVQRQADNSTGHSGGMSSNQRACDNSSAQSQQQNINKFHRHPESHKIHQQYSDQRHTDSNIRHPDMTNPSMKHSESDAMLHWPQQSGTTGQKNTTTTSPQSEGVSLQKCLENGMLNQTHTEHTENRCLENGIPTSRYTEHDTRLSHRYQEGGTLSRRYAESNKSLDGSGSMPTYQDNNLQNQKHSERGAMVFQPVSTAISSMYRNTNNIYSRSSGMKSTENLSRNNSVPSTGQQSKLDNRSTLRYSTQKLVVNGKLATPLGERPMQNGGFTESVRAGDLERLSMRSGNFSMPARARLQRLPLVVPNGDTVTTPYMHTSPKSPPLIQSVSPGGQKSPTQSQSSVGSRSPPHSQALSPVGLKSSPRSSHSAHSPSEMQSQSPGGARSPAHSQQLSPGRQRSPTHSQQVSPTGQGSPTQSAALPTHGTTDAVAHSSPAASPTHSQQSTSRASYLAYRRDRDRGLPNFEGSYKRTMSPSGQEGLDTPVTPVPDCERLPTLDPVSVPVEEKSEHHSASHRHSPCTEVPDPVSVVPRTIEEVVLDAVTDPPRNSDLTSDKCVPDVIETETQCDLTEAPVQRVENRLPPETPPEVPPTTPTESPPPPSRSSPKVMESLQLMQRSEVVLRVNAATSDAASQTETEAEPESEVEAQVSEAVVAPPVLVRQKLQEEIECERLSLDLASQLPPSDKLQGILVPDPEHKKPTDYVSGLFRLDVALRPRTAAFRSQVSNNASSSGVGAPVSSSNGHVQSDEGAKENANSPVSPLPASSKYFTISESKAKFLTRYVRDMSQLNGLQDNKDLHQKKEELMTRLDRKLEVLRGEHLVVTEESRVNDELGESVAAQVSRLARPHEAAKYRLHVEEVGKITSLLLGLSGRLARAENALMGLPHHHSERKILESKRDKLKDQLEEAKKLKENIDRRSVSVSNILYKYFNSEEYADYDHFINMKAKLIMDSREIADKIKLGEEQLAALKETLCTSD